MPQRLYMQPGQIAGDPAAVVLGCRNLAIQRDRCLQHHQWTACPHELDIGFVQLPGGLRGGIVYLYFNACGTQPRKASTRNHGIRILHRRDHFRDAGFYHRVHTRPGAALVRAGFQRDVECRSARALTSLFQRHNFSMFAVGVDVITAANHFAFAHNNRAHRRVRTCLPKSSGGQFQGLRHIEVAHLEKSDSMNVSGSNGSRSPTCSPTPI